MSVLAYNRLTGEVRGIKNLQEEYEQMYGPGNYVPPVAITYWAFRIMIGPGLLMAGVSLLALFFVVTGRLERQSWFLKLLPLAIALPYISNTAGWILTEVGRQPWIVYGLMRTEDGVSLAVSAGTVLLSLLLFILLYAALMAANVHLMSKYARKGEGTGEAMPKLIDAEAEGGA